MSINSGKLFVITGPRGVGKTTLAATYLLPAEVDKVFYHDSENSANHIVKQLAAAGLAFGHYVSLNDRFSDLPAENDLLKRINSGKLPWVDNKQKRSMASYYETILDDLDKHLEHGKYQVYIHDTLEKLEAGMAAWVELNKSAAGVSSMAFGRLWTEGVFPLYEQLISAVFARGVETVILTSHLRTPWEDNRPVVGKVAPAGKKLLYRMSSFMLWLVNDARNADGAPAGLVLKERLGMLMPDEDGQWRIRRMLPHRIPHCTWVTINEYLRDGCNLDNPKPGEVMSAAEQEMISELLSDKQMELMVLTAEKDLEELKQQTAPLITTGAEPFDLDDALTDQERAQALADEGKDAKEIASELGRPLPLVRKWLERGSGE